jgi:hypothetical protein
MVVALLILRDIGQSYLQSEKDAGMQYAVRLCGFFVRPLFPCSRGVFCFSRRK